MIEEQGYKLEISADKMKVLLTFSVEKIDIKTLLSVVVFELAEMGVAEVPAAVEMETLIWMELGNQKYVENMELITGRYPEAPQDAKIVWAADFFDTEFVDDEKSNKEYRLRKGKAEVTAGDLLATLVQPKPGKQGVDVFGNTVEVREPDDAFLEPGGNVSVGQTADGSATFSAEIDGRIRHGNGLIAIDKLQVVDRDLDRKEGKVVFDGSILIKGDVLPGAHVEAEGDVEVWGTIEQAYVKAGGSLWVREGITRVPQPLEVGGRVVARYIREAKLHAGEEVAVANEILNSEVITRGRVDAAKGQVIGGTTEALLGLLVRELGSEGDVNTRLSIGFDSLVQTYQKELRSQIEKNRQLLRKIEGRIQPKLKRQNQLSAKEREAVTELMGKTADLETNIEEAEERIKKWTADTQNRRKTFECSVAEAVYPGVHVNVLHAEPYENVETLSGPLIGKAVRKPSGRIIFSFVSAE